MSQALPSLNVIGAGRLGRVIAKLLVESKQVHLQAVCNRRLDSAAAAVDFIGSGVAQACEDLIPADITMITTPDDAIEVTCKKLAVMHKLGQRSVVFHCSGALSSSILQSARECYVASVHPVKSFADPQASVVSYAGTLCSIEGGQSARDLLQPMFSAIGSSVFAVKAASKASYHAAMVFAANYSVALYEMAMQAMQQAEIDESIARQLVLQLMQGTVDNLQQHHSVDKVLSGPLMRGDVATIAAHIDSLPAGLQVHYKQLGLYLMQQLNLPGDIREQVAALFS
jgi:predicted short-subunit dehydrogenase-like oxidoreductase (DUF2520 family)